MKIVVIDDDVIILKAIENVLEKENFEVKTFTDGREAIDFIGNDEDVKLVVTDIMMPFISGIEILHDIKSKNEELPVIIISALDQREVLMAAVASGAEDFVRKPVNMDELIIRAMKALKMMQFAPAE